MHKTLLSSAVLLALAAAPHTLLAEPQGSAGVMAAQQSAAVHGRVYDAVSGDALQGAIIRVQGTGHETVSSREGTFQLSNLPAGTHQIRIDYVGYANHSASVTVDANQRVRLDAAMAVSERLQDLDTVKVVGYRGAQSRSLSQQRAADGVVNVVSADTLGEFPDVSVAESVARIAGVAVTRHRGEADAAVIRGGDPSWTRVALDGLSMPDAGGGRSVALGQLTSEVISAVEITKAATPDMDADAIGGTINIVTRGALTSLSGFSGKASLGHSELGSADNYDYSLGYSTVLGDINSHGLMLNVSQSVMDREMNNKESSHRLVDDEYFPDRLQTKAYNIQRERGAVELRYDFQNADENRHYFVGFTRSEYLADEDRHNVIIRNRRGGQYEPGSTPLLGIWPATRIEQNWRDRHDESKRNLLSFGANNAYDAFSLEFRGAYGKSENIRKPGRTSWSYRADLDDRQLHYDYSDPDFPELSFVDTGEVPTVGGNVPFDDLEFRYGSNYLEERWQEEESVQTQLKIEVPMDFGSHPGFLRFGGKYASRDRDSDSNRYSILAGGPLLSQIVSSNPINNFGRFPFGYRFDKEATHQYKDGMTLEESIENSWADDFAIKEEVAAVYGMAVVDLGAWRLVGGVRGEHTRTDSQGWRSDDEWATTPDPTQFKRSYTNWFPSLHLKRDMGENLVLRASYSSGIARPSFSDLRPTVSISDHESSSEATIRAPNMELKPALSQSLDLSVEYYIEPIGLVSAGVFTKRIKDVHFEFNRIAMPGENFHGFVVPDDGRVWRVDETTNGEKAATIHGLELSWDQALTFLPAPFNGLGVFSNYSYIETKSTMPTGESAPLGRQPEHTLNFAVYYERAGFSTRLAYNLQTKGISDYGDGTSDEYLWWDKRAILDWTARYRINSNLSVFAEAGNLTDSRARRYRGDHQRVEELEDFGRTYSIGVRFRF